MRTSISQVVGTLIVVALGFLPFGDAQADSPADQYETFDPTILTIKDSHTKLRWQRFVTAGTMTYADAETYCKTLFADAGVTGFRIPTMNELLTLVDEEPHQEYEGTGLVKKAIDRQAFPKTPSEDFWTSSDSEVPPDIFVVNFSDGRATRVDKSDPIGHRVRCVRFDL